MVERMAGGVSEASKSKIVNRMRGKMKDFSVC